MTAANTTYLRRVEDYLRNRGVSSPRELQRSIVISQPTLSRAIEQLGTRVLRFGNARSTRYALVRNIGNVGSSWPLYRIDARGRAHHVGRLHAIYRDHWWFDAAAPEPALLYGEFASGIFPGLPWFLYDMRPQGFVGRAFGRRFGAELGLNPDVSRWSHDDTVVALVSRGNDASGDFILGDDPLQRARQRDLAALDAIGPRSRKKRYVELAGRAISGEVIGSSAGGEQPKFTAYLHDSSGPRAVLVKFSPSMDGPSGRRWADLLVAEHCASEVLREHDVDAARTDIVDAGGRRFLEVDRFDRVGAHGRRGFVSLEALDADYYGHQDDWASAAERLELDGWLTSRDAERLRTLRWFASLIANTDAHFGNVGFTLGATRPLALAPLYDMLPMMYRPAANGEILEQAFDPLIAPPTAQIEWRRAALMADQFWLNLQRDLRVSGPFRAIAKKNQRHVQKLLSRFG